MRAVYCILSVPIEVTLHYYSILILPHPAHTTTAAQPSITTTTTHTYQVAGKGEDRERIWAAMHQDYCGDLWEPFVTFTDLSHQCKPC